ncbi:WASH complex subunit 2A-like isoform X1 [Tiliqua scincoides]|uniref:WASH complex subunit 2A-like isoform X1 n=1 Tax=Tiliqua scincoides TaxID=71010 RepID=UPI0034625DBD
MSSASSSSEAAAPPGAEPAAGLPWERAWSLEEIRGGSQGWSLAADAGLLHFLQEFSQQTISKTHEIKTQLDRLIHETKSTDCRLHNVFNGFLMLSNTQFIENRVYDEEVEEPTPRTEVGDKSEQEKTREQKEADLIPKIQEAVNYGLQVLDSAFEQLDIKAGNSDSEEETNERIELILEPKDLYIDRPLPYLIGSQLFMEQDDVGLGDLSSEEGSVDSDRGSMIDSEGKDEEELEEEFGNISEEDQKPRITLMSDEDDDDLFGDSEKGEEEEEDLEENARLRKKRPTSFTDELTARIKGDVPYKQTEEQLSDTKTKMAVKDKEEIGIPSDDDEDIFKPPKLTDEDFSPFSSKGGLFSGGTGLFDDDDESDLFAELPKGEDATEKEARVPINDEPSSKAVRKVPAGAVSLFPGSNDVFSPSPFLTNKEDKKLTEPVSDKASQLGTSVSLFDDDDDFKPNKKSSVSARSADDLFDYVDEDLFKGKPDVASVVNHAAKESKEVVSGNKSQPSSAENIKTVTQTLPKDHKSLFSDEEDSEQDLFSSNQTIKSKSSSVSSSKVTAKMPLSLFEDEDEEELFGSVPKTQVSKPPKEKAKSLLFSSDEEDHWNITKEIKPASRDNQKKETMNSVPAVSHTINKSGLFEEEGEEDLFAITKDSQRKPQKVALLFEDDVVNGDSLFGFQPSHLQSSVQARRADLLESPEKKLVEEKVRPLDEPNAFPGSEDAEVADQQRKPLLEKDARRKVKNVFSLFEEDEKSEDTEVSRSTQKEMEKSPEKSVCPKSTGVFQDEELLFSHKLQKDNDPDVDLFASNKKGAPKPRIKLPSGGGLFGVDDDDDDGEDNLFSTAKSKSQVAENKIKDSSISSVEDHKVLKSD